MHILVVEDDHPLRASIARGLREASYVVDEAAAGDEGLSMATMNPYDAVVLDILLPEMDGVEVCKQLRARDNWVPILILTALDAVEQRIRGLNAGADDYLGKPFDFGELIARLRALTRRRGEGVAAEIQVGDLSIDTRRRRVRSGERAIELTAKEFDFLLFMARNAGRVVTRAELLANVWDDPRHAHSNVIDVHTSRLRRKLSDGMSTVLLSTLRGVGYMLDVPSDEAAQQDCHRYSMNSD
jgi:DNA-binding response OmpR family regulator